MPSTVRGHGCGGLGLDFTNYVREHLILAVASQGGALGVYAATADLKLQQVRSDRHRRIPFVL
jgi:hypothetical protein